MEGSEKKCRKENLLDNFLFIFHERGEKQLEKIETNRMK